MKAFYTNAFPRHLELRPLAQAALWVVGMGAAGPLMAQTTTAAATTTAATPPAVAAPESATVVNVVVTARKRDEKALDVPISVKAYSEKELQAADTFNLQDMKTSAGIGFNQASGTQAAGRAFGTIVMRGLQPDFGLPADNSGSLFVDGIFVSGGQASVNTSDVERVEVLKGPQNAFFGRSTFGGAINFVTKRPSETFKGSVSSSASARGSNDETVSVEGPLVDNKLSARLTIVNHDKAAEYRATDGGALGAEKSKSLSATLFATPTDQLWLRFRGAYQQDDDSTPALALLSGAGNTSCSGKTFGALDANGNPVSYTLAQGYFCNGIPNKATSALIDANTAMPTYAAVRDAFVNNSLGAPFFSKAPTLDHTGMRRNTTRLSAQAGYDLDDGSQLAFNIGSNDSSTTVGFDLDRSKSQNFMPWQAFLSKDLTVDARWSSNVTKPLRGLVGLSYFTSKLQFGQINWYGAYGATTASVDTANFINNKADVPALYGSAEYDILRNLTMSADARYQRDTIDDINFAGTQSYSKSKVNVLPRVSLRFKPTSELMTYASYSEGVKPLAQNGGYLGASADAKAYLESQVPGISGYTKQSKLKSSEVGIKQSLLDGRASYSLTAYNEKWLNRPTNTTIFNPDTCTSTEAGTTAACPLSVSGTSVAYANQATIRGLELAVDAALTARWSAGLSLDYKHARWDTFRSSGSKSVAGKDVYFNGNSLGKVPAMTWALNSTYRMPLANGWTAFARGDVMYTGSAWDSDYNTFKTDQYYRVNARVGGDKGPLSLELFAKNLFNDRHWDYAMRTADLSPSPLTSFSGLGVLAQAPDKRELGVRLRYEFQ